MFAAEVVERNENRLHGFVVLPALAVAVRKTGDAGR
jgi:hypothetical protein